MPMANGGSLMAIVPISFFLTVSFFVLFALRKVTDKWLKVIGYTAVSLLLLASLVVFAEAVVGSVKGFGMARCPSMGKMRKHGMGQMMGNKNMPGMPMSARDLPSGK